MEKTMKARVQHKHDIEANWLKATNFTPLASEIIVYDSDENYDYPRIKIGDGKTNVNGLPFLTKDYAKISDIPTKPEDIGALPDSTVIPTVPTKISAFENDKGYLTQHQSLDAYAKIADLGALATKDSLTASDVGALPDTTKIPSTLSDLTADSTHRTVTDTEKSTWNAKANTSDIPTKVSDLTNDKGYITTFTETDPTVPSWAKQPEKPTYTASEVGALSADTVIPTVPTKVSAFTNDAGYLTGHQDISGKVDKDGITLGIHTDSLIYIFVDGKPVGVGVEMPEVGDVYGYVDSENNIVVKGNLADGTYSVKYEMEDGSTVEIGDLVLDSNVYYTVTSTLTNCTSNNSATKVADGGSYSATISAKSGYEMSSIKVTMGGTDISSSAVSGGKITISNVTGNIVITAVATEVQTGPTNLSVPSEWADNSRLSISSGNTATLAGHSTTNYIPAKSGDVLRVKGLRITGYASSDTDSGNAAKIVAYNANKTKVGGLYGVTTASNTDAYGSKVTVEGDVSEYTLMLKNDGSQTSVSFAYIRIDGFLMDGYTKDDVIITINEEIVDTPAYKNLLPLAVNADGTPYEGGKGYKSGYKMSTSSGNESATTGAYCSGFMPIANVHDIIRVKNVTLSGSANVNNFVFYDANKTKMYTNSSNGTAGAFHVSVEAKDGYYEVTPYSYGTGNPAFFRFSCGGITDATIVTVNEEIV